MSTPELITGLAEHAAEADSGQPVAERINAALREHQQSVVDWGFAGNLEELYRWAEVMVLEFKLEIPQPCLAVDRLRRAYGHFRHGRNGFGLRDEIAIDRGHLERSPRWRVLGTLFHELLHSWQEHHGKSGKRNYHNVQFRKQARSFGLVIDQRGFTEYDLSVVTPFRGFLEKHGIEVPAVEPPPPLIVAKPRSKLKLYECPCGVKVRVGRSRFDAKCLDCCGVFALKDGPMASVPTSSKPEESIG